jgi:putative transposase
LATVTQAYRFALDPTPQQRRALASHCGAARVAHNWGLRLVQERLEQRRAGQEVEVPWTLPALRREWNQAKDQVAPWWPENSKEAYSSGLDGLARALKNWSDARTGRRKGRPVGFPRFKKKWGSRDACRFTTGQIKVLLEQGSARILAATISRTADRWFVSFTVEVQRHLPIDTRRTVVGVDVGVRQLAVLSDGTMIANPRALEDALRKLRRLNRQLARREPGSERRKKTHRRLARVHARTANIRRDALHKLTSSLATEYGTVVVERLNVGGMIRNRRLARAITDTGLAEIRRQLTYKTTWYGSRLVVADRFYPSSRTCSACGWVKAKLTLAEHTFICETCGVVLDRDLNAARNLAKLAQYVAQSGWETQNARGADRKTQLAGQVAMKREPSSADIRLGPTASRHGRDMQR